MHLKGEGTPQKNTSLAVDLYEEAAALGSIKALNGLGYIYFYGESLPKNETKAFQYFLSAADASIDGDSLTNAAHCLLYGIGVQKNQLHAVDLYKSAATKFGSFGAVSALAKIYMDGQGVSRNPSTAMLYLNAAVQIGPWSGWLRRGLDAYLAGLQSNTAQLFSMSLMCYLQAGEIGIYIFLA
jgi:TPR repeat protein